jgi:hypothetical protein
VDIARNGMIFFVLKSNGLILLIVVIIECLGLMKLPVLGFMKLKLADFDSIKKLFQTKLNSAAMWN